MTTTKGTSLSLQMLILSQICRHLRTGFTVDAMQIFFNFSILCVPEWYKGFLSLTQQKNKIYIFKHIILHFLTKTKEKKKKKEEAELQPLKIKD